MAGATAWRRAVCIDLAGSAYPGTMRQPGLFDAAAEAPPPTRVAPGDIYALGRHRLMCGDATDKAQVTQLFAGQRPTLVVTSPPYAKQRDYDRPIACWDSMMLGALDGHDFAEDVQMLVNLGVLHSAGEWQPYWSTWIQQMRARDWRHYAQYVWDKKSPLPGCFKGRLNPSHEFVFHLHKRAIPVNKWLKCAYPGHTGAFRTDVKNKEGLNKRRTRKPVKNVKAPGSVISVYPVNRWQSSGHPAQMPVALASFVIKTWSKPSCIAYDPFAGAATTLHAAQDDNAVGLGMEVSPAYCTIAINRWNKAHPDQPARKVSP